MLDSGDPVDAIYLDFRKAFDTVPHQRLLNKLKAYGIVGDINDWIRAFLTGRTHRVVVNSSLSSWLEVLSGIPQGSVLGPILFVLFINDLPDMVRSTAHIFADDTKVYRSVLTEQDCVELQADLTRLVEWSEKWQMEFNADKCKVLHLGHSNRKAVYKMGSVELQSTPVEKDLGVFVDDALKFRDHVSHAVNKASRLLGLIKATFSCIDGDTLPRLFTTLVRPHLEYGNIIWHPRHRIDKLQIEKIQRRATKLIPHLKHLPYEERLQVLKLPSLDFRRHRGDMIQVYKIMNGLDRLDPELFFQRAEGRCTRGHKDKLLMHHSRLEIRKNVFSQRIVQDWNSLSELTVAATTLNIFKSRLDKQWQAIRYVAP